MQLQHLGLTNFRNYARLELDLPAGVILLQGGNAQGKTNLLEAVYLLSRLSSPRASSDSDFLNWLVRDDDLPFARLVADLRRRGSEDRMELSLIQSRAPEDPDHSVMRKQVRLNGVDKRIADAVGVLSAVAFLPEDIGMVCGAPGPRRRYLDETISQVDPRYRRELQQFKRVLSQRNYLLKSLRERNSSSDELAFWNQRLVKHGAYVLTRRLSAIRQWNELVQRMQLRLTDDSEWLQLEYRCAVDLQAPESIQMILPSGTHTTDQSELTLDEVRDRYAAHLEAQKHEELRRGMSLIGPHRDDIAFIVNGRDMAVYGSRGQQRTSALALKLTEVEWIAQSTGDPPVLLLDDVISELDATHRSCLERVICEAPQALVTTTDTAQYSSTFLEQTTQWQVEEGRIQGLTRR